MDAAGSDILLRVTAIIRLPSERFKTSPEALISRFRSLLARADLKRLSGGLNGYMLQSRMYETMAGVLNENIKIEPGKLARVAPFAGRAPQFCLSLHASSTKVSSSATSEG